MTIEAARQYLERGWAVIPIPLTAKAPRLANWQDLRITRAELPKYFNGRPANIGVLLGEPSGGLIDVDLDSPEALSLADYFLSATECVFGRASKPRSHRLYRASPPTKTEQFRDVDGAMLVELRSTGVQTIVPPSIHPRNEPIAFDPDGAPADVRATELREGVARLAAAALIARHWPKPGSRHRCGLALAGALLRAGKSTEDAQQFVQCVAWAAGDEEWQQRGVEVVPSTEQRLADGRDVTGTPTLRSMLGEAVANRVATWLGLAPEKSAESTSALLKPLDEIGDDPSIERLEGALRVFAAKLRGADDLRRAAAREQAIERLRQLGVKSPAGLVEAALKGVEPHIDDGRQGHAVAIADIKPWPSPVDGAELLDRLEAEIRRYVVLPKETSGAIALWVMHDHVFDAFGVSPYLAIISPTKQCGKTTLLIVLSKLVSRPLFSSNLTPASLFRAIETYRPTLLIDEADTFLKGSEELRGMLNAGHTKDAAHVLRVVGDKHELRQFSVWAPKIIAKIGALPDTIASRSIIVPMRRRTKDEPIERWRDEKAGTLKALAQQVARWAKDHAAALGRAEPEAPEGLNDRTADNWRPLFAIADLAGGDWPARAREAALALSGADAADDDAVGVRLLRDIQGLFDHRREAASQGRVPMKNADRFASRELAEQLGDLAERPWCEFRKGKPISPRQLANLLKPYKIFPKDVRKATSNGEKVLKGYELEQFEDAFRRYLAEPATCSASVEGSVADDVALRNGPKSASTLACSAVALRDGATIEDGRPRRRVRLSEVPD